MRYTTLPVARPEYDSENEQVTRRTIEPALQDGTTLVERNRNKTSKPSSLAIRRFQFLLMGASGG